MVLTCGGGDDTNGIRILRGARVVERGRTAPARISNEVQQFRDLIHVFTPAVVCEQVQGEMKCIVPVPIVRVKGSPNIAYHVVDGVRMSLGNLITETDHVVNGLVRIAVRIQIPVRGPGLPPETASLTRLHISGHVATARTTRHSRTKKPHIL